MAEISIHATEWKLVQVGRVVIFTTGPFVGKLAAITEIIDHKRVLVEGPSSKPESVVPRQAVPLSALNLTAIVIPNLPFAIRFGALKRAWEKAEVEKKYAASAWAKRTDRNEKRKALTDFERFKVMKLRKQARFQINKESAKLRAAKA